MLHSALSAASFLQLIKKALFAKEQFIKNNLYNLRSYGSHYSSRFSIDQETIQLKENEYSILSKALYLLIVALQNEKNGSTSKVR
jgi:hypothetical protein